jgi:hypothetical protein
LAHAKAEKSLGVINLYKCCLLVLRCQKQKANLPPQKNEHIKNNHTDTVIFYHTIWNNKFVLPIIQLGI